MFVCVAGKNNIAVDILEYLVNLNGKFEIGVVCNRTETGQNTWQKSLRWFAKKRHIKEYHLEDVYKIDDLVFLSLEFDRIIETEKFKNARLYNIHFSKLPKYKGMYTSALPILNGEKTAGVTFHIIDDGIDTGDIIAQQEFSIEGMTCKDLYLSFIKHGTDLVKKCLNDVLNNSVNAIPQPTKGSTYYSKKSIDYQDLSIDYNQTADVIDRQIRAFSFREYQLPKYKGKPIISTRITDIKSVNNPKTVLFENENCVMLSTIDYNIVLFYDRFKELMEACEQGNLDIVKEICNEKRHINERNEKGWTPLIVATYNNRIEIVKYLISHGANIYAVNNNGTNLLMYAKDASVNSGDSTLFYLYKSLGLSESLRDYNDRNLCYYLNTNEVLL